MSYIDWLAGIIFPDYHQREQYHQLLFALYDEEFTWRVRNDGNRAEDGINLRTQFENETGLYCDKYGSCSVLEVLIGLAIRCENELMYDPDEGNRTSLWFWDMVKNLGLTTLDEYGFDYDKFDRIMQKFLGRKYDKDGFGGPFFIEDFEYDMRKTELWYQLNYYVRSRYSL